MISIIESIFGSKVGRVIAEILVVLLLIFVYTMHLEHVGAKDELAKIQKSSAALIASARADITKETSAHAADIQANTEKTNAALAANTHLRGELDQRVRDFDAYRRAHPDVPRTGGGPLAAGAGECGTQDCGDLAVQLAERGNELAGSLGELTASLQSCERDRDSLTGLPRNSK